MGNYNLDNLQQVLRVAPLPYYFFGLARYHGPRGNAYRSAPAEQGEHPCRFLFESP